MAVLCKAKRALRSNARLSAPFLRLLYEQLNYVPTDFFTAEFSRDNFLAPALADLFQNLTTDPSSGTLPSSVNESCARLLEFVRKRFGVFEASERRGDDPLSAEYAFSADDEDLPTVVTEEELGSFRDKFLGEELITSEVDEESSEMGRIQRVTVSPDDSVLKVKWSAIDAQLPRVSRPANALTLPDSAHMDTDEGTMASRGQDDVTEVPLAPLSAQALQYSWRYPLLFEEMRRAGGREDLLMTATRLIDKSTLTSATKETNSSASATVKEAYLFVELEASHLTF